MSMPKHRHPPSDGCLKCALRPHLCRLVDRRTRDLSAAAAAGQSGLRSTYTFPINRF
jgi:hypothetical protein